MQKIFLYISIVCLSVASTVIAQTKIEKPKSKSRAKAFAIFVDQTTYNNTKDAILAYQEKVEADGLPTYIISGKFERPEDVKKEIIKLYKNKQSLEGVVFIGDIPIPMIRNAQHMTSAFKMNEEKFAFDQSSVPSDRYYDDLNLTFDYIKQDDKNKALHYYKLRENSVQTLKPSIYSARIRYPKTKGCDQYQAINDYLMKVVKTDRNNILDNFVAFTGAAYNSECLVAWKDDLKAYKEDFPYLTNNVNSLKQLNFRMNNNMKFRLFDEMQRPDVDVLLLRKHGTPTKELINNEPEGTSIDTRLDALRRDLYSSLKRAKARKMNVDSLQAVYMKKYDLSNEFFAKLDDKELAQQDSTVAANTSIHTEDLRTMKTNPTYIILDACYNGSYHEDDYIAGHYIFNAGNTIAAQGNTRNVLQDKWTMNLTGLLSYGVRLGKIHNMNATLENHLIGDPTFHFGTKETENLNIKLNTADASYWEELLKQQDPIYQAIALRKLAELDKDLSDTLFGYFSKSPYRTVRLQALRLLADYNDQNFNKAVKIGLKDEYEMIARQSAIYSGKIGDYTLLNELADVWVNDKSRQRVQYNIESNLRVFKKDAVEKSFIKAITQSNRIEKQAEIAKLQQSFAKKDYSEISFEQLMSNQTPLSDRIDNARTIRNYNFHDNINSYIALLNSENEPTELRIVLAEALGWFNYSYTKPQIIAACQELIKTNIPKELKDELIQTINRLN